MKDQSVYFIGIRKGKHVVSSCSKYRNISYTGTMRFKTREEAQKEADKLNFLNDLKESIQIISAITGSIFIQERPLTSEEFQQLQEAIIEIELKYLL